MKAFLAMALTAAALAPAAADDGCPNCQAGRATPVVATAPVYTPDPPPVVSRGEFDSLAARVARLEQMAPAPRPSAAPAYAPPPVVYYAPPVPQPVPTYHAPAYYSAPAVAAPAPFAAGATWGTTLPTSAPPAAGVSSSRSVSFQGAATRTAAGPTGRFGGTGISSPFGGCANGQCGLAGSATRPLGGFFRR